MNEWRGMREECLWFNSTFWLWMSCVIIWNHSRTDFSFFSNNEWIIFNEMQLDEWLCGMLDAHNH